MSKSFRTNFFTAKLIALSALTIIPQGAQGANFDWAYDLTGDLRCFPADENWEFLRGSLAVSDRFCSFDWAYDTDLNLNCFPFSRKRDSLIRGSLSRNMQLCNYAWGTGYMDEPPHFFIGCFPADRSGIPLPRVRNVSERYCKLSKPTKCD